MIVLATNYVRKRVDEQMHLANNEVAGFIFGAVSVVYGVLLAFMVLVVQQAFEGAHATVEQEANALVDLYRVAQELPEPYGAEFRTVAVEYAQRVLDDEWDLMQNGNSSPSVDETLEKFWLVHRQMHTNGITVGSHDVTLFEALENLGNQRRIRLLDSRLELPGLMYILLIGGGIVTVGFTLFLRAPNWKAHLLMAAMFTGVVSFVLVLIIELDNPFTGDIRIQPDAFEQALALFKSAR